MDEKYKLILDTIKLYPKQILQSWQETQSIQLPDDYEKIENIVFCGMGGSALGARMVDSFTSESRLRVPFEIFTEFHIPDYASDKSLVIISSYSGNTEETINAAHMAISKGAKVFGITTGGKLKDIFESEKVPAYIFDPKNNPSGEPRMSIGYATAAVLAVITKLGLAHVTDADIESAAETMELVSQELDESVPSDKNIAKNFVLKIKGKVPVLVASEHLVGVTHAIKNQFNENAKTFATLFDLPELNHHLMEGLIHPAVVKEHLHFVFFTSNLYPEWVSVRYPITQDVIDQNNIGYSVYHATSDTKLSQVFEVLTFGSFVVYYLARELGVDPTVIPWVDYFKERLA